MVEITVDSEQVCFEVACSVRAVRAVRALIRLLARVGAHVALEILPPVTPKETAPTNPTEELVRGWEGACRGAPRCQHGRRCRQPRLMPPPLQHETPSLSSSSPLH